MVNIRQLVMTILCTELQEYQRNLVKEIVRYSDDDALDVSRSTRAYCTDGLVNQLCIAVGDAFMTAPVTLKFQTFIVKAIWSIFTGDQEKYGTNARRCTCTPIGQE